MYETYLNAKAALHQPVEEPSDGEFYAVLQGIALTRSTLQALKAGIDYRIKRYPKSNGA